MTSNESTDNTTKITDVIAGPNYLQTSPQPLCGATTSTAVDIEQTPVEDDPRQWPNLRKVRALSRTNVNVTINPLLVHLVF